MAHRIYRPWKGTEVYSKGSVKLWEVFILAVCFCYFGGSICIICWGGVWLLLL